MSHNPLFPSTNEPQHADGQPPRAPKQKVIQPLSSKEEIRSSWMADDIAGRDAAANVIRQKLDALYEEEPSAQAEIREVAHHHREPSKHQKFLQQLQATATSVADVQIKWHEYYASLPLDEQREVWDEFYAEQAQHSRYAQFQSARDTQSASPHPQPNQKPVVSAHDIATPSAVAKRVRDTRSANEIRQEIRENATPKPVSKFRQQMHSVMFGLSMGAMVLVVMLFGLFNEMVIARVLQPSRNVSATPIILGTDGVVATGEPKVIIPKINLEVPVDYGLTSLKEDVVQKGLENGVVHYPITSKPGEMGNSAFFGHSSNNIFNPGKYKFAFVLLNKLEDGDMFYITTETQVYAYRVFKKQIVAPTDMWVLNPVEGKPATAALITCDPPGTTLKRLVVWGEQISPDPIAAAPTSAQPISSEAPDLPGAPKTLWQRLFGGGE